MEKIIHYCWFGDKPLPKLAKKCLKSWKKYLPDYKIMKWSEENVDLNECPFIKEAYENKKWAFVADYARTKALNEYGGIYFDTDMEVIKDISHLLEDDTFLGVEDTGFVAVGVWYEKEKNSFLTSELLKKYRSFKHFEIDNMTEISIPKLISKILEPYGLKKGYQEKQVLKDTIHIYPRDYFYPYSFYRDNNIFSDNTCMIHYYDASWIPRKERREMRLIQKFGRDNAYSIINRMEKLRIICVKILKVPLFPLVLYRRYKRKNAHITKEYLDRVENTVKLINDNKDKEYLTIYNSEWLGVTSATKELFDNLVDCGELYRKKEIKKVYKAIMNTEAKQVVFSSFAIGWHDLVRMLKKGNKDLKIKTYWHGNNSQVLDKYGWDRNMEIVDLHRDKCVDVMGSCKKSLIEFYKNQGFNAFFLTNIVSVKDDLKEKILKQVKESKEEKKDKEEVLIGIYAAKCTDWRKNMYTQMASARYIENAVIDMVPLSKEAKEFAKKYNIKIRGVEKSIPREELMTRMAKNDVNLYITFSECAPMLPLESMELDVPCITGNNHHYFQNSEIEKYIVVKNEVDVEEIVDKINYCVKNKSKIMKLYKEFSEKNFKDSKKQIKDFLNM